MHSDASGVQGPDQSSSREWLNSVPVADRIVRDFTCGVIQNAGPGLPQWVEFEARRLNGLFLGTSPTDKYNRGPWNTPDQCGMHVLLAMHINGSTHLAVRDACTVHALKITRLMLDSHGKS